MPDTLSRPELIARPIALPEKEWVGIEYRQPS